MWVCRPWPSATTLFSQSVASIVSREKHTSLDRQELHVASLSFLRVVPMQLPSGRQCDHLQTDKQADRQTTDVQHEPLVPAVPLGAPHRGMPSADAWPALQQKQQSRPRRSTALRRYPAEEQKCQPESQVTSVGATAPLAVLHSCSSSSCNDTMNRDGPWRGQLPSWLAGSAACFAYGVRAS